MWEKIKAWFKHSETIFWARLQVVLGATMTVLANTDPTMFNQYVPPNWLPIYIVVSGILTEILRRRGMNPDA